MMNPFGRSLALACSLALVPVAYTSAHQAAARSQPPASTQPTKVEDRAQKARGTADNDPNVKTARAANDPAKQMPAPAAKGGPQARGQVCGITVDNYTPWLIELYMEGGYWAEVPRWGTVDVSAGAGRIQLYARARFTDGSIQIWGPRYFDCVGQNVTWTLRMP